MKKYEKASVSHEEIVVRQLRKNPDLAAEYLRAAMEEDDEPAAMLVALRRVAEAIGMAEVAAQAGLKRESLYRVLSPKGNPTLRTIRAVTKSIGVRLSFERVDTPGRIHA